MNLKQAKNLKQGDTVYHTSKTNVDGSRMRAKVTSIKTWKTRPDEVLVKVKHGLYDYASFNECELDQLDIEVEYHVTGILRNGRRFKPMVYSCLRTAMCINLWSGSVWEVKNGKRKLIKSV